MELGHTKTMNYSETIRIWSILLTNIAIMSTKTAFSKIGGVMVFLRTAGDY